MGGLDWLVWVGLIWNGLAGWVGLVWKPRTDSNEALGKCIFIIYIVARIFLHILQGVFWGDGRLNTS